MRTPRTAAVAMLALLPAGRALAQFELQVVDAAGARTAPALYDLGTGGAGDTLSGHFRLRNSTAASATASVITVAGMGFSLASPALPAAIDAQAALEFSVSFRSSDLGSYSAVLRAANTTILLTATVEPRLTWRVEDAPLGILVDFGSAQRGGTVRRRFTILNETPAILTVPAISLAGADFAFAGVAPSGSVLNPQKSAAFAVDFAPSATGPRQAVLTAGGRSAVLLGMGLDPPLPKPWLSIDLRQAASAQQGTLVIAFDRPAAAGGSGTATLDFRGAEDPTVAFAGGGRTATFAVTTGDTRATLAFQTGTTAGTLVFGVRLGDASETTALQIPTSAPALTAVRAARTSGGIEIDLTGWDNGHSVTQLGFTFFDAAGSTLAPGLLRVDASAEFGRYYAVSDLGGAFALRAVFPVTGDTARVSAFEVSLANPTGTVSSGRTEIR